MPSSIEIRRARSADIAPAGDIMVAARHAAIPAIPPPVHSDAEIRSWFTDHVSQKYDVWVAAEGPTVVAVLVLSPGWIEQLYVIPSLTGRGIGSLLVDHAKGLSDELALWTFVSNDGAQRFYERHGFVEVDRTDGDNEEGAPDIKYRWQRS